jgi:hypothetical protein
MLTYTEYLAREKAIYAAYDAGMRPINKKWAKCLEDARGRRDATLEALANAGDNGAKAQRKNRLRTRSRPPSRPCQTRA